MQCMNCKADIPPQFVASIRNNVCPGCGEKIYTDEIGTMLTELKEAMAKMPNDPEGLAGWLLSHYSLTKIGTAEPAPTFHRKNEHKENDDEELKINSKENKPASTFFKRAGVENLKNPKIKKMAEQIKELEDGDSVEDDNMTDDEYSDTDDQNIMTLDALNKPIDNNKKAELEAIFEEKTSPVLERMKLLREQSRKDGAFRRKDD